MADFLDTNYETFLRQYAHHTNAYIVNKLKDKELTKEQFKKIIPAMKLKCNILAPSMDRTQMAYILITECKQIPELNNKSYKFYQATLSALAGAYVALSIIDSAYNHYLKGEFPDAKLYRH